MIMKRASIVVISGAFLFLSIAVGMSNCGGGGGGGGGVGNGSGNSGGTTPTGLTTFSGGTLADLKALSPSLTFDELKITGGVVLPDSSQSSILTTITANKLTITSTGGFRYNWFGGSYANASNDCKWVPAPSLTLNVSGDVVIDGNIALDGRPGVVINSIYDPCKWCNGMNGGNLTITGNTIMVKGELTNTGGDGALTTDYGNHCGSGDSGSLKLAASTTMDLCSANFINKAGSGMDPSHNGSSGNVNVSAGGAYIMRDGNIVSTGPMTFSAATTDIWGTIRYGSLNETIGGAKDTDYPTITVLSSNVTATYNENAVVKVQASDLGMGLRGLRIQGLGNDQTYDIADCGPSSAICTASALDSTITITGFKVNSDMAPLTLQVTAIDNKGNATLAPPITGILMVYPAEKEPNDSIAQAQVLDLNGVIDGNLQNGDAGSIWQGMLVEDFYKVTCCAKFSNTQYSDWGFIIDVDFSGSAAGNPDIDVYLMQPWLTGAPSVAESTTRNVSANNYTEHIQYVVKANSIYPPSSMGVDYIVGVRAYNVPIRANYRIKYNH
jgi:hypothetical protein